MKQVFGNQAKRLLWLVSAMLLMVTVSESLVSESLAADSAVVVMYHRFGEDGYPSTNVTLAQFEAHVAELKSGPYTVLPLLEIVQRLRAGTPLPDRTVGLTMDDAYRSVFTQAWPRLRKAGLPFTVFVPTDYVDGGSPTYMTWEQIRELARAGMTIGNHGTAHPHLAALQPAQAQRDLDQSRRRFKEMLGAEPALFAYPYGEAGTTLMKMVRDAGLTAAFGQHSGAMGKGTNPFYLPRFAMGGDYADMGRFRRAINARALPVSDVTPADPLIGADNPPAMGFTVAAPLEDLDRLSCYASHVGKARVSWLGARRAEIRVSRAFPPGRTRLNCTLPAGEGRWYWLGRQFFVPD
jgi:poly-beta-1,6-N-acetyl-D-glucosamine N-deacetylase